MTEEQACRQRWFTHLKSFASSQGELHPYGSELWCALPDNDWRKIAAAVVMGEHYKRQEENLATHVFDEWWAWREVQDAFDADEAAAFASVAAGVRRSANSPTMAERLAAGYIPRRLP